MADRASVECIRSAGDCWDCALTVFVIQEVPDLDSFLRNLGCIMRPGMLAIAVTVHPDFAGWLREAGRMTVADIEPGPGDEIPRWRWAGRYPIVDEPREPFYLPYFHYTEEDYREAFRWAGFRVREMRGIPSPEDIARLRERRISPFAPFETNVYWPRMAERPSGLIMVAEKENGDE